MQLAEQAVKEKRSHIGYLEALLDEGRTRAPHAIATAARCPAAGVKTLEEFDFTQARQIPAAKIRELAEGGYLSRANRWCFWANAVPARPTWRPAYAWRRAGRNEGCDSPRRRTW